MELNNYGEVGHNKKVFIAGASSEAIQNLWGNDKDTILLRDYMRLVKSSKQEA